VTTVYRPRNTRRIVLVVDVPLYTLTDSMAADLMRSALQSAGIVDHTIKSYYDLAPKEPVHANEA